MLALVLTMSGGYQGFEYEGMDKSQISMKKSTIALSHLSLAKMASRRQAHAQAGGCHRHEGVRLADSIEAGRKHAILSFLRNHEDA